MTIDQLKAIDAVIRLGSYKAAAISLNKTQPAISSAIKKLEEHLNIQIFSRDSDRVKLTEAGQYFYLSAKYVLTELENLNNVSKRLQNPIDPKIRIVTSPIFPLSIFFKQCNETLTKQYPHSLLNIKTETLGGVLESLRDRGADIAFCPLFSDQTKEGLELKAIMKVEMVPVVPATFSPAQITHTFLDRDLHDLPQAVIEDTTLQGRKYNKGITEAGRTWVVDNFQTKKDIVLAGLGWGRIPRHMIDEDLKNGKMIEISTESVKTESYIIYAVRLRSILHTPLLNDFWKSLCSNPL